MNEVTSPATITLAVYCTLILVASLVGGLVPGMVRLTHTRMQVAISFVSGLMLGVGVLHLLPHAWHEIRSIDRVAAFLLAGFLVMFFLQRSFHFHHHDVPDEDPEGCDGHHAACCHPPPASPSRHEAQVHHDHTLAGKSARHLSWGGAALGLTLHTLIDGVALAASVAAESHGEAATLAGIGTFLVVALHKPFDAMVISTLMAAGGWSRGWRHLVNALFALAIPAGVLVFHFGAAQWSDSAHLFLGGALAFAAGTFICIAASDLLPELQFHSHDRIKLSLALLLGLCLAVVIGKFETSGHDSHAVPMNQDSRVTGDQDPNHDHDHEHDHEH